jgi:hypothetical protein
MCNKLVIETLQKKVEEQKAESNQSAVRPEARELSGQEYSKICSEIKKLISNNSKANAEYDKFNDRDIVPTFVEGTKEAAVSGFMQKLHMLIERNDTFNPITKKDMEELFELGKKARDFAYERQIEQKSTMLAKVSLLGLGERKSEIYKTMTAVLQLMENDIYKPTYHR